ncbi:MAG: hypothetical protein WKF30_01495, partial [Pyrinomonadaceae bacterium]
MPTENAFAAADHSANAPFIEHSSTSGAEGRAEADHVGESASSFRTHSGEYHLTILEDTGIATRLGRVLSEVKHDSELTWPEFKRDPFNFTGRVVSGYGRLGWRFLKSENVGLALVAAFAIVFVLIGVVFALDRTRDPLAADVVRQDLEYLGQ